MDPIIFNSMILIFLGLVLVPRLLEHGKHWLVGALGLVLLPLEILVIQKLGNRPYPTDIWAGLLNASLPIGVGYLYYNFVIKKQKEKQK